MITTLPNANFSNVNTNALISQYAQSRGAQQSDLLIAQFNKAIFDAAPVQFPLLRLLNMFPSEQVNSDEFFFSEAAWQRSPIQATAAVTGTTYPTVMVVPIASFDDVALGMQLSFPNGQQGVVVVLNQAGGTISVRPQTNSTLPTIASGDNLSFAGTIEADGAEGFQQYFRMSHITKYNYVQLMPFAIKWGKIEFEKYKRQAQFSNFMPMQMDKFMEQARVGLENVMWQGIRGEFVLADGTPAKTMGGIDYFMTQAGSPTVSSTIATVDLALEQLVSDCQFGSNGSRKMLFGAPRQIRALSKIYKSSLTRYEPQEKIADLMLDEIRLGDANVVLVPVQRFEDSASFPASWAKRLYLTDLGNVRLKNFMAPQFGTSLNRDTGLPVLKEEMWIAYTQSMEFNNPLSWGKILLS
jgi:hypothetical protein